MWVILVIALSNLALGYAMAVYTGYAPKMRLPSRRTKPAAIVPTIADDDIVIADHE